MKMISKSGAIIFVILMGIVSLFGDMTYEGARSIVGQYLAILGASGLVVGAVAGFGELIGYGFRLVTGYLSDKTGRYWAMTFVGFACNLLAVPLLALAVNWQSAAALIILERFGKAIRTPSRDAMLSYATKQTGRGWGFGLHEAMDQIGAILGPLMISLVLFNQWSYRMSFALLLAPALLALGILTYSWKLFPRPQELEVDVPKLTGGHFTKKYWLYMAAVSFIGAGYVDFALIAYHFKKVEAISDAWVPILFSISMGAAGVSALIFGRLFDLLGLSVLIFAIGISSLFSLFVFIDGFDLSLIGMILWGIGLGAQESIMRAFVANIVPMNKRGTAYGILNISFGVSWFLGSALMGFLYDVSLILLVIFSLGIQLLSLPIIFAVKKVH